MRHVFAAGATLLASTALTYAGGLDRSNLAIAPLFETGSYAELSFGSVSPEITGNATSGGTTTVNERYSQVALAYKQDINEQLSFAVILDQPYGANTLYKGNPAASALGGTEADISSKAVTALLRYKFNDNWSAHGGIRAQRMGGSLTLSGLAYAAGAPNISGYNLTLDDSTGYGGVIGVAYERPEIAMRVALTYHTTVSHDFKGTETLPATLGGPATIPAALKSKTPESINLDFQTGIAADTLLFGSIRYAKWGDFEVISPTLNRNLAGIGNSTTWNLGVGRRLSDAWAVSASLGYEKSGNRLVSALAPTNGFKSLSLGAAYTKDNLEISGGVRYVRLGDANPSLGTPPTAVGTFHDNKAVAYGLKIGYSF